jgi:uncharacterized protein YndB with AHSA1/START domain
VTQQIRITQLVVATREQIWRECTEARGLANWQADAVKGKAKLGAKLELTWAALDAQVELEVTEWVRGERISFEQENGRVTLELGDQTVTLTHEGFDPAQDVEGLTSAWYIALAQLAHAVERHPGRSRRVHWRVKPMAATPELVHLALTEKMFCQRWLCKRGHVTHAGSHYYLELFGGDTLSGRVLANTPGRDIALSCREAAEASLALRTFPLGAPDKRLVAFCFSEWGPPSEYAHHLLKMLERSLDGLQHIVTSVGSA